MKKIEEVHVDVDASEDVASFNHVLKEAGDGRGSQRKGSGCGRDLSRQRPTAG